MTYAMAASTSAAPMTIASARAVHLSKRLDMVTSLRIGETSSVTTGNQRDYRRKVNWRQRGETAPQFQLLYVSALNAVLPRPRSRTRRLSIATVRHVFLEEDGDGPPGLLAALTTRCPDLPPPSYVLHSSPGRLHVFWRTRQFERDDVEILQKRLAS